MGYQFLSIRTWFFKHGVVTIVTPSTCSMGQQMMNGDSVQPIAMRPFAGILTQDAVRPEDGIIEVQLASLY